MTTYRADGFRPIHKSTDMYGEVQNVSDAAALFAGRLARREYGRRAYCRTIRADSWAMDGSSHTFEAFIGTDDEQGNTVGRNVWVYVDVDHA